jgi:hypothetical protein
MFVSKLALLAGSALLVAGAVSPATRPADPVPPSVVRSDTRPPFKCMVAPHVDSLLARWSRGDVATAVQAFAPDGPGGFSGFSFGPVRAAHRSELSAQMSKWHPEPALRALEFRIIGFESEEVMNVGSIQIGSVARRHSYDASATFNCRTLKFVSFRATVPTEP